MEDFEVNSLVIPTLQAGRWWATEPNCELLACDSRVQPVSQEAAPVGRVQTCRGLLVDQARGGLWKSRWPEDTCQGEWKDWWGGALLNLELLFSC